MGNNQQANLAADIRKTKFTALKDQQCSLNMQIRLAMQLHDKKAQEDLEQDMNVYMMKYKNGLPEKQENDTDSAISAAQRMHGTEVYRRIKECREDVGGLREFVGGMLDLDAVRVDTAVISEEGRLEYSKITRQKEGTAENQA